MAGKKIRKKLGRESPKAAKTGPSSTPNNITNAQIVQKNVAKKTNTQSPNTELINPPVRPRATKFPEKKLNPFEAAKTLRDVAGEEETMPVPVSSGLRNFLQQTSKAINAAAVDQNPDSDEQTLVADENRPYRFVKISYSSKKFVQNGKLAIGQSATKKAVQIIDTKKNQGEKRNT